MPGIRVVVCCFYIYTQPAKIKRCGHVQQKEACVALAFTSFQILATSNMLANTLGN
jgi:hypothetical protein